MTKLTDKRGIDMKYCEIKYITPYSVRISKVQYGKSKRGAYKRSPKHAKTSIRHMENNRKMAVFKTAIEMELNFTEDDLFATFTFEDEIYDISEVKRLCRNLIKALERKYAKHGVEFKAIFWIEGGYIPESGRTIRPHIHMLLNNAIDSDLIEKYWKYGHVNLITCGERFYKIVAAEGLSGADAKFNFDKLANYAHKQKQYIHPETGEISKLSISHTRNLRKITNSDVKEVVELDDNNFDVVPEYEGYVLYNNDPFNCKYYDYWGFEVRQLRYIRTRHKIAFFQSPLPRSA